MQKKLLKVFYHKKVELSEVTEKRTPPPKATPKIERNMYIIYLQIIFALSANGNFLQKCINFVEQQLRFFSL